MKYFLIYYIFINIYGLLIMYIDKQKAIKSKWRIPEARLFATAIICGSIGILSGMFIFRHKTKHLKFLMGIPAIILIQVFIFIKFGLTYVYKF